GRFVLRPRPPGAVPDLLQLGHHARHRGVDGDVDARQGRPRPVWRLLLQAQAAPEGARRPETPEGGRQLRGWILPESDARRARRADEHGEAEGHDETDPGQLSHAPDPWSTAASQTAIVAQPGRVFHRRCTQNHGSGWARTWRSIVCVKDAVLRAMSWSRLPVTTRGRGGSRVIRCSPPESRRTNAGTTGAWVLRARTARLREVEARCPKKGTKTPARPAF